MSFPLYIPGLLKKKNNIPRNGLIGEWLFSGNANDSSGKGHNGIVSGATLTTDRFGSPNSAYDFSTGFIKIPHHSDFNLANNFSICFWLYAYSFSNYARFMHKNNAYGTLRHTTDQIRFQNGANPTYAILSYSIPLTEWVFFVIVKEGSSIKFYKNAATPAIGTDPSGDCPMSTYDIYFGIDEDGISYPFNGKLDDIRIFNKVLISEEITQLYNE